MPLGADRSSIIDSVTVAAKWQTKSNLKVESDMRPEQGFFLPVGSFSLRKGRRAVGIDPVNGDQFNPPLKGEAAEFAKNYNEKYYHQVSDEYHDWWDMSAMVQEAGIRTSGWRRSCQCPADAAIQGYRRKPGSGGPRPFRRIGAKEREKCSVWIILGTHATLYSFS